MRSSVFFSQVEARDCFCDSDRNPG